MDDQERSKHERELAIAILILWIFFDEEIKRTGSLAYALFRDRFNATVRPILSVVYGMARARLAEQFGVNYPTRPGDAGVSVISLPNLNQTIEQYGRQLYDSFINRVTQAGEEAPTYTESDAERTAVTSVTGAASLGEVHAAADVESRRGIRLVAIWITEPGACKICRRLEGQPWRVWRHVYPNGPPGHPRCRCRLVWRPLLT